MKIYFHHLATLAFIVSTATLAAGSPSIQITNAPGGTLTNSRLDVRASKLFVTGSFDQSLGQDIPAAAHVDVELLAADGSLIAEGRDDIDPSHPRLARGRHGRIPFVISFPADLATPTSVIRLTYHPAPHS